VVGGRSLHTKQGYSSDICGACVKCLVSSVRSAIESLCCQVLSSYSEALEWVPFVAAVNGACCSCLYDCNSKQGYDKVAQLK
jgi:hypothetical protein